MAVSQGHTMIILPRPRDPGSAESPELAQGLLPGRITMRWIFASVIALHGLLHLLGFLKAFGWYEPTQLTVAIPKAWGFAWLAAAVAVVVTAGMIGTDSRGWWALGLGALVLSQAAILSAWPDAKFGSVVNALLLLGCLYGMFAVGPYGLAAEYQRAVSQRLPDTLAPEKVTEADLTDLPAPVQRFLRHSGVVGRPRVHNVRAVWRGRIRGTATDPWMEFTAEQHNFVREPTRLFFMNASRSGLPVDVYHVFSKRAATMQVRLLSVLPLVDAQGPELTRAETVTLFNDLCLLAPSELVDPSIRWEAIDEGQARGRYTVGANTISAVLSVDEEGNLLDFVSDDRLALSSNGKGFVQQRWSTPIREHQVIGSIRAMHHGEGWWHPSEGAYAYLEIELVDLKVNLTSSPGH
ncbi:MAG: hypothetical protein KC416_06040 [Myxococcales bacterium]|nr:hypothetical protein [Myxococcales bacterium]